MDAGISAERPKGRTIHTGCCIVGGGPAGMMLGYLLGRAGVETLVLEKHADFFRDFRGDTVHPSTLQVMDELGLIDGFLKLPHQQLQKMDGKFGDDFNTHCGSQPSEGQIPLHCLHAAMGFSQFPARERQALCLAQGHDEYRGDRSDLVGRYGDRGQRRNAGGAGRNPRRSHHRMRRPAFDRAAARQPRGDGDRGADGCAVVSRRQARR